MLEKSLGDKSHDLSSKSLLIKFIGNVSQLGMDIVTQKLWKPYKDVGDKQLQKLWTPFYMLVIKPIVLTNSRPTERILSPVAILKIGTARSV